MSAATALRAPGFHVPELGRRGLADLRRAIDGRRKVRLEYQRGDGARSRRALRPLGLFFWGDRWSLAAWCELRQGFRHLRLDRIRRLCVLDSTFENELGRTLDDYRRRSGARRETLAVSAPPGCSLEAWTEGIRLEKERSYFDEREPKLGLLCWLGAFEWLRRLQWTAVYRLGTSSAAPASRPPRKGGCFKLTTAGHPD